MGLNDVVGMQATTDSPDTGTNHLGFRGVMPARQPRALIRYETASRASRAVPPNHAGLSTEPESGLAGCGSTAQKVCANSAVEVLL
jgi:hypothetical protein